MIGVNPNAGNGGVYFPSTVRESAAGTPAAESVATSRVNYGADVYIPAGRTVGPVSESSTSYRDRGDSSYRGNERGTDYGQGDVAGGGLVKSVFGDISPVSAAEAVRSLYG